MKKRVELCEERGSTSVFISAEIREDGTLVLEGQDVGEMPEKCFGDADYEYWLVIAQSEKDRVLRLLLHKTSATRKDSARILKASQEERDQALLDRLAILYGGNTRAVSAFGDMLREEGIPCDFASYS
jgi:hypothetical protein